MVDRTCSKLVKDVFQRRSLGSALLSSVVMASVLIGSAQASNVDSFPSRPIHIVVGFPPGGSNDAVARIVGKALETELKQPVVIENRAGAGGTVGNAYVGRAEPDGYTLFMAGNGSMSIGPAFNPNLPYNPLDFTPISMGAMASGLLVTNKESRFNNLSELIDYARSNPDELVYASSGVGALPHYAGEYLKSLADVKIRHVPYKGGAQALTDLVGGRVDFYYSSLTAATPLITTGKLKALASSGSKREASLPDVPAATETLPGYEVYFWYALYAPPKTPDAIADKLAQAIEKSMKTPEFLQILEQQRLQPVSMHRADLHKFIAQEIDRVKKVVEDGNLDAN